MIVETQATIEVSTTRAVCPIGERTGQKNHRELKIPVLSCEGACIRGEIARLAANMIAQNEAYGRGCHGELITVPDSAIARWIKAAEKVVLIDGCFLRCHGVSWKTLSPRTSWSSSTRSPTTISIRMFSITKRCRKKSVRR